MITQNHPREIPRIKVIQECELKKKEAIADLQREAAELSKLQFGNSCVSINDNGNYIKGITDIASLALKAAMEDLQKQKTTVTTSPGSGSGTYIS